MDAVCLLELRSDYVVKVLLDKVHHALIIQATRCGKTRSFIAQDQLNEGPKDGNSTVVARYCECRRGCYWLFHEKTEALPTENGVDLVTCPVNGETGAPLVGMIAHYQITICDEAQGIRIKTWFTCKETQIFRQLSWMQLSVYGYFTHLKGFGPTYESSLDSVCHPLCFDALALTDGTDWAILGGCGQALWTPESSTSCMKWEETEQKRGILSPKGGIYPCMDLSQVNEEYSLSLIISFGQGDIRLPEQVQVQGKKQSASVQGTVRMLTSGPLQAAVSQRDDGVSLFGIHLETGACDASVRLASLSRMTVLNLSTGEVHYITTEKGWQHVRVNVLKERMSIYLACPQGIPDLALAVEAYAFPITSCINWKVKVLNANENYSVLSVTYPSIAFSGGDATIIEPCHCGIKIESAYDKHYCSAGTYPAGFSYALPLYGAYDQKLGKGIYVAIHDTRGTRKDMRVNCYPSREGLFEFEYPAEHLGCGANAFELAGVMVWQLFCGDWFDLAQIYRAFVANADWMTEFGREDSPQWMRDVPLYIMDWMPNDNPDSEPLPVSIRPAMLPHRDAWYQTPIRLAKELSLPIGYHLYNWHWIPFNNDFPHYFPVKEGLAQGVSEMHRHQIYVMPYCNGRLWDTHDRRGDDYLYTKEAYPGTAKDREGHTFIESYTAHEPNGELVTLAVMCPESGVWRKKMAEIARRLFYEYDMDAIYIDQISAAQSNLCCDPTHNHSAGNGDWWVKNYRLLMERLRAEAPQDRGYTSECNAEPYTNQFDGFLTWTWITSNLIPVFSVIYGGHIAMFGRNTNGYKKYDVKYFYYHAAQSVLFGQQIGWINADVVDDPNRLMFLKKVVQLRWEYKEFFSMGTMLRPPKIREPIPRYVTDTGMNMACMFEGDTLLAGVWQKDDLQTLLIMLINVGDEPQDCSFSWKWNEYSSKSLALKKVMGEGELLHADTNGGICRLPARSLLALKD